MSFLDDIIDPDYGIIDEMTRRRLEFMIGNALLDSDERLKYELRSGSITQAEAEQMISDLKERMPIMGLHRWPLDMKETGEAIRYQVAKDDLHEERWSKQHSNKS
jgi:hypothetical protein